MFVLYKTEILTKVKAKYKIMKGEAVSYTSKAALLTTSTVASLVALMASRSALSSLASVSTALTTFFYQIRDILGSNFALSSLSMGKPLPMVLTKNFLEFGAPFVSKFLNELWYLIPHPCLSTPPPDPGKIKACAFSIAPSSNISFLLNNPPTLNHLTHLHHNLQMLSSNHTNHDHAICPYHQHPLHKQQIIHGLATNHS